MTTKRPLSKREIEARVRKEAITILRQLPFPNTIEAANKTVDAMFRKSRRRKASASEDIFNQVLPHLTGDYFRRLVAGRSPIRLTEDELEARLATARTAIPSFAIAFRKKLKEILKELPRNGGPGRESALTPAEKIEAIELMTAQVKLNKLEQSEIYEYVASIFKKRFEGTQRNVEARTMKRYWEGRALTYGQIVLSSD